MGCGQSKIDMEESVMRCKERRRFMQEAVAARSAFAAAHAAYTVALKDTGAALSDFGQVEFPDLQLHQPHSAASSSSSAASSSSSAAAPSSSSAAATVSVASSSSGTGIQPPVDNVLPPPPPRPDFSTPPLLARSASVPISALKTEEPKSKMKIATEASITEEEDEEESEQPAVGGKGNTGIATGRPPAGTSSSPARPPPPPQPQPSPSPESPPMPMQASPSPMPSWDFFFFGSNEHMPPPPTLSHPEDSWPGTSEKEVVKEDLAAKGTPQPTLAGKGTPQPTAASKLDEGVRAQEPHPALEKVAADLPPLPKAAKKQKPGGSSVHHQHAPSAGAVEVKRSKIVAAQTVSLQQILHELDDHFLKASVSAQEVSKLLEAARMHYHSNFADNRGHIDHSARVMQVITWNRSFKGIPRTDDNDDFDDEKWETHATILDKMLAWEKKLYDEIKACELMKIEYQRKVVLLNKLKKRGARIETMEKVKSAVSHLHTRYIVDIQSLDSTVSEINRLNDHQLYPKLVHLVDEMSAMWGFMYLHHVNQYKIISNLRNVDMTLVLKETTEEHYKRTHQLWQVVMEWHTQFQKLMTHKKQYITALISWLRLNLIPTESSLKEKVSSPPRQLDPPIKALLHVWLEELGNLPIELAKNAIFSFSEVIHTIFLHQQEELKLKTRCDDINREHDRKKRSFDNWYQKHMEQNVPASSEGENPESGETANSDPVTERRIAVESLGMRLKEEQEKHRKLCKQVREKSLVSLRTHLPELFRSSSEFALKSSEMYKKLVSIAKEHSANQ